MTAPRAASTKKARRGHFHFPPQGRRLTGRRAERAIRNPTEAPADRAPNGTSACPHVLPACQSTHATADRGSSAYRSSGGMGEASG